MRSTVFIANALATLAAAALGCAPAARTPGQPVTSAAVTHAPAPAAKPAPSTPETPAAPSASPKIAADPAPAGTPAAASSAASPAVPPVEESAPPLPPNTVVLHVGDSFLLANFSQTLRPKMKELGASYQVKSEQASYTSTWAGRLQKFIGEYNPDLVIINLGANEVTLTDPPARAPAVEKLIKIVGARPCVWVLPPLWRKDTGFMDIIRTHSSPCRLFDSDALVGPISRQHDGAHPDDKGGALWADTFFKWLLAQRAPAPKPDEPLPPGSGHHPVNPWRLKPSPSAEHQPRPSNAPATAGPANAN
jgi:hypothetical protein